MSTSGSTSNSERAPSSEPSSTAWDRAQSGFDPFGSEEYRALLLSVPEVSKNPKRFVRASKDYDSQFEDAWRDLEERRIVYVPRGYDPWTKQPLYWNVYRKCVPT